MTDIKNIAITGAKGTIGKVIVGGLSGEANYKLTELNLPENDVRNYETVLQMLAGKDVVIHLAWNTKTECDESGKIDPDNTLMFANIYRAAVANGVKRVIMASSVHADNYLTPDEGQVFRREDTDLRPTCPYGVSKINLENLGRFYSRTEGLEVICIRFGGVGADDEVLDEPNYERVWLSSRDCVSLVRDCIEADDIPNNFEIIYAVSNNRERMHDYSNSVGWEPQDSCPEP